jgi:Alg9-like mannosyltransferase family
MPYLLPAICFVILYSGLGHKEVRFLYPVLPLFNMSAAVGLYRIHSIRFPSKDKVPTTVSKLLYTLAIVALMLSFFTSSIFVAISRYNYPGGDALQILSEHIHTVQTLDGGVVRQERTPVNVHIDVASAMTGVNLFGQRAAMIHNPKFSWSFNKDGYEIENSAVNNSNGVVNWSAFTHLLTESKEVVLNNRDFRLVGVAQGYPKLNIRKGRIDTSDAIFVYERRDWNSVS